MLLTLMIFLEEEDKVGRLNIFYPSRNSLEPSTLYAGVHRKRRSSTHHRKRTSKKAKKMMEGKRTKKVVEVVKDGPMKIAKKIVGKQMSHVLRGETDARVVRMSTYQSRHTST